MVISAASANPQAVSAKPAISEVTVVRAVTIDIFKSSTIVSVKVSNAVKGEWANLILIAVRKRLLTECRLRGKHSTDTFYLFVT
ncbi:hypothetical protein R50076_12790 [Gilvimarinus japonicus]